MGVASIRSHPHCGVRFAVRAMTHIRATAAAIALLASSMLLISPSALAHAALTRSQPEGASSLSQPPAQVELWFSEQPEPRLSQVTVSDEQGQPVDVGPLRPAPGDSLSLIEQLRPDLPKGTYTVSWRTTSTRDGHVLGGSFAFSVGVSPATRSSPANGGATKELLSWPAASIRWLNYLAFVLLFGVLVFESEVVARAFSLGQLAIAAVHDRIDVIKLRSQRLTELLAGIGVIAASAAAVDQVWRSTHQLSGAALEATADTALGAVLLLRIFIALAIFTLLMTPVDWLTHSRHRSLGAAAAPVMRAHRVADISRHFVLSGLALVQLFLLAITSHALSAAVAPALVLLLDWAHLALGGVWVGGLAALALAAMPERRPRDQTRAQLEPRSFMTPLARHFSRLALLAAVGLGVTGLCLAVVHVGSLENVPATAYGRALAVKTLIFAATLILGAFSRFGGVTVWRGAAAPGSQLSPTLPIEAALAIGVLAAAAIVTGLPPARDTAGPANAAAGNATSSLLQAQAVTSALPAPDDVTLGGSAGDTLIGLSLRPGRPGVNQMLIYVLSEAGEKAASSLAVKLQVQGRDVALQQCAATCRVATVELQGGEAVRVSAGQDGQAAADFRLPDLPAAPGEPLLAHANNRMHQLETLRIDETLGPADPLVEASYALQAPDKMSIRASTGEEMMSIGKSRFIRSGLDQPWQSSALSDALRVPFFMWDALPAQSIHLTGTDIIDGAETVRLSLFEPSGKTPTWFRLWVDASGLVHKMEMRAPRHFMDDHYYAFDEPLLIQPPATLNS